MKVEEDELMTTSEGNVEYIEDNLLNQRQKQCWMWRDQIKKKRIQIFNIHPDKIGECEDEKWRLKMN